jgi:hypothetical protein
MHLRSRILVAQGSTTVTAGGRIVP